MKRKIAEMKQAVNWQRKCSSDICDAHHLNREQPKINAIKPLGWDLIAFDGGAKMYLQANIFAPGIALFGCGHIFSPAKWPHTCGHLRLAGS